MKMKRLLALLLLFALAGMAHAEEEDWLFVDLSGDMVITYDAVEWNFPVDVMDMEPELVILVNKSMFLDKSFKPDDLVDMKRLKLDKEGNNISGGVRMVDSSWQLQRECAEALVALCDAARAQGHELYLKSAYRSYYKQAVMYENRIKKYGYSALSFSAYSHASWLS